MTTFRTRSDPGRVAEALVLAGVCVGMAVGSMPMPANSQGGTAPQPALGGKLPGEGVRDPDRRGAHGQLAGRASHSGGPGDYRSRWGALSARFRTPRRTGRAGPGSLDGQAGSRLGPPGEYCQPSLDRGKRHVTGGGRPSLRRSRRGAGDLFRRCALGRPGPLAALAGSSVASNGLSILGNQCSCHAALAVRVRYSGVPGDGGDPDARARGATPCHRSDSCIQQKTRLAGCFFYSLQLGFWQPEYTGVKGFGRGFAVLSKFAWPDNTLSSVSYSINRWEFKNSCFICPSLQGHSVHRLV